MKKIRNEFTDALDEEITARKILDKTKVEHVEDDIFLSEVIEEKKSAPEIKKVSAEKISLDKIPVIEEKISKPEKKSAPKKIIITKADFEKRVFAEADNDFYDDIRSRVEDKKNMPPIFHSKNFSNSTPEPEDIKSESLESIDLDLYRKLSRAEIAGVTLSVLMMIYSFMNLDKPLFFVSLSLLSHLMRPLIGALFGKHNRAVQNALRSFSIVLFLGALLFLFM